MNETDPKPKKPHHPEPGKSPSPEVPRKVPTPPSAPDRTPVEVPPPKRKEEVPIKEPNPKGPPKA